MKYKSIAFIFFSLLLILGFFGYTQEPFSILEFAQYVTDDDPCNIALYPDYSIKAPPGETAVLVFKANGDLAIWGHDSKHTLIGKFEIWDFVFIGDEESPLRFRVDKEAGYVYIKGKGTIAFPDGGVEELPKKTDQKEII